MKGGKQPRGYTIIEVMIVLGISGVMFLIASSFVNGKQQQASFKTGVNEMAAQIQDTIESVINGRYSDVQLKCDATSPGAVKVTDATTTSQGTFAGCTYMGKLLHFYVNDPGAQNPESTYETLSIAGRRLNSADKPATSLTEAAPGVAGPLTTQESIPEGLFVKKNNDAIDITLPGAAAPSAKTYVIGFMQSLPSNDNSGGGLMTGAQTVSLYYLNNVPGPTASTAIGALVTATSLVQAKSASICLSDGTLYAQIIVGGDTTAAASQLGVGVKMLGSVPC